MMNPIFSGGCGGFGGATVCSGSISVSAGMVATVRVKYTSGS